MSGCVVETESRRARDFILPITHSLLFLLSGDGSGGELLSLLLLHVA